MAWLESTKYSELDWWLSVKSEHKAKLNLTEQLHLMYQNTEKSKLFNSIIYTLNNLKHTSNEKSVSKSAGRLFQVLTTRSLKRRMNSTAAGMLPVYFCGDDHGWYVWASLLMNLNLM